MTTATTTPASATATAPRPLPLGVTSTAPSDEMRLLVDGQKKIHEQILKLQAQIEDDEAAYLEETAHGNIIRGWDGFIDSKQSRKDAALKKVKPYTESEHLFSSCCFYKTLALEPTLDAADYFHAPSARRRLTVASSLTPVASSVSNVGRPSSTLSASSVANKLALERKSSFSGPGTATPPTLGRPPKIKKRKRLDRLEIVSTASATQSETGEDDDKDPPLSSATLKKSRSTTSDVVEGGDFVDML